MGYEMEIERERAARVSLRNRKLRSNLTGWLFVAPFLIIFVIFTIYPFIYGIAMSFCDYDVLGRTQTKFVGFDNFSTIFTFGSEQTVWAHRFWNGLGNTAEFAVLTIPFVIVVPLLLAWLLNKKPWGFRFFRSLFFLPTVLSLTTVAIIWRNIFATGNGFINSIITQNGGNEINFLTDPTLVWVVLVVVTVWWTIGTNMVIFQAGLEEIDTSLYEAASTDGAGTFSQFIHITLPGLRNQFVICFITTTVAEFNVYGQPLMLTGGGPSESTYSLIMYIRDYLFTRNLSGLVSAMGLLLGVILIVLSILQNVMLKERKGRVRREIRKA